MYRSNSAIYLKKSVWTTCRFKSSDVEYQYLQRSKVPTMHFQKSLPRLPIPKLEKTCERYLAAQKPILADTEFQKTELYVHKFRDTVGKSLQKQLVKQDKQKKHTSYISDLWFNKYLSDRTPLPVHYNPMLVFQNDPKPEYCDQGIRAANLVISSLRFYRSLKENVLEPEVFHLFPKKSDNNAFRNLCSKVPDRISWYIAYLHKAYPLDMSQYYNLFNSTRIPEMDKDRIYFKPAKHVTVQFGGNFYAFDVLDDAGNILEPEVIYAGVREVLKRSDACEHPLGVLTTMNRDKWAKVREELVANGNGESLEVIDTALFNVCLDQQSLGDDKYKLIRKFLHDDGVNRWFDKSFSLQLSKDGYAGVNFEHSWGDGVAILRYFEDIYKDSTQKPRVHPDTKPTTNTPVKKIEFNLNDSLKCSIQEAAKEYREFCESLDINFVESEGLGKKFCKQFAVSPDAIMQLAFQSAYYKQYSKFVPTYESCSTAAFKHGRTETIRPCTTATKAFCQALHSKSKPSNADLANLIKECSRIHSTLTKEAAMGQGFDRHLYALKSLAERTNLSTGDVFTDPSYQYINHIILSTSTLSSPFVLAGGFGPVVQEGYGVGYVIRENAMGTLVSSYPGVDGKEFINCLKQSIGELVGILQASKT